MGEAKNIYFTCLKVDSHETMSLVANYSGSESDQSGSDDDEENTSSKLAPKTSSEDTQNINFLTAEFSESESEDERSPATDSPTSASPPKPTKEKMPLPSFQGSVMEGGDIPSV